MKHALKLPVHNLPSPEKPGLQLQVKLPRVSAHCALVEQLCIPVIHSLVSAY